MYFVVGLGNPGSRYDGTRHNVGFEVTELLSRRHGFNDSKRIESALVALGKLAGSEALLIRPMTYMNLSGEAVGNILRHYRGSVHDVIVVHDDLDFEPGVVRVKCGGGHGGHNGLRSVSEHIGRDFIRVRIGIGKPPMGEGASYVLERADQATQKILEHATEKAADAVDLLSLKGLHIAMQQVNRRGSSEDSEHGLEERLEDSRSQNDCD